MENPTTPKNSKFIEDLQKANQEIEADLQIKKPAPSFLPESKKENPIEASPRSSLERSFDQDLVIKAEEVAKEKKRLEEIQQNLEKNQKQVAECIQELTILQGEIAKVFGGKKKIDEDLQRMKEKNQKIFEDLKDSNSFWSPKHEH